MEPDADVVGEVVGAVLDDLMKREEFREAWEGCDHRVLAWIRRDLRHAVGARLATAANYAAAYAPQETMQETMQHPGVADLEAVERALKPSDHIARARAVLLDIAEGRVPHAAPAVRVSAAKALLGVS